MLAYVLTDIVLSRSFGNTGVWIALLTMYTYRAIFLSAYLPSLMQQLRQRPVSVG